MRGCDERVEMLGQGGIKDGWTEEMYIDAEMPCTEKKWSRQAVVPSSRYGGLRVDCRNIHKVTVI